MGYLALRLPVRNTKYSLAIQTKDVYLFIRCSQCYEVHRRTIGHKIVLDGLWQDLVCQYVEYKHFCVLALVNILLKWFGFRLKVDKNE